MANKLIRVPEVTIIPGTLTIAPQPRRCYPVQVGSRTETYQDTEGVFNAPGSRTRIVNDEGYGSEFDYPNTNTQVTYGQQTGTTTVTRTRTVGVYETRCTEAVEGVQGTPTIVNEDYGPDWLSSARSASFLKNNGAFRFDPVDVVIGGLANRAALNGVRLSQVVYGILVEDDGSLKKVFNGAVQPAVLGNISSYTRLEVYTLGGRSFLRGYSGGAWLTLAQDNLLIGDTLFAAGFTYREASALDNPELAPLTIVEATSEDFAAGALSLASALTFLVAAEEKPTGNLSLASFVSDRVDGRLAVPAVGSLALSSELGVRITRLVSVTDSFGLSSAVNEGIITASILRIAKQEFFAGNRKGGVAQFEISKQTLEAGGDTEAAPTYSLSGATLTANSTTMASFGLAGGVGGADLDVADQELYASNYNYASAEVAISDGFMSAGGFTGIAESARNLDFLFVDGGFFATAAVFVSFGSDLGVDGDASVLLVMNDRLESSLELGGDITFASIFKAAFEDSLFLKDGQQEFGPAQLQYVYNLLSGAVSRFEGFSFKGMATTSAGTFGYTDDGVYKIVDAPEESISALVDFGDILFGTTSAKRIETVFLGLRADGDMFLSLDDGKREYTYKVVDREPTMRVVPGRGMTGREWGVKLELLDVTRAQLDDVEFVVATSTRRWTR